MAPNAFATGGSLSSTSAVTTVAARPTPFAATTRAAVFAERPRDRQQRQHAERRLQLQHESPANPGSDYASAGRPRNAVLRACPLTSASRSATRLSCPRRCPSAPAISLRHGPFLFFLLSRSLRAFQPDRGGCDRLANLRHHRQRLSARHGRAGAFLGHGAAGFRGRPRRRPVRAQARGAALPTRGGGDRAVSGGLHLSGWLTEVQIFIATFVIGIAGAFEKSGRRRRRCR